MQFAEDEIIQGCIRNEYKAQKMLFKKYRNILLGVCMRYCQTKEEAEDVLLIGYYRIYKNIGKYKDSGSFESWMKRIVINVAIDNYRKNKKYYYHDNIDDLENIRLTSEILPDNLTMDEILQTVNELSPGYRMVFNLYTFEGYFHKEIANMLDISESTSKTQLRKARLNLRKKLHKLDSTYTKSETR